MASENFFVNREKTIGIIGGMGPESGLYFLDILFKMTKARKDQDHVPFIMFNNPKVPDRTDAILGLGPSPLPYIIEGATTLEKAGAGFIVMPCVTGHFYYSEIIKHISIPFLNLLEEVHRYISDHLDSIKKIGLLATSGTVKSGLFQTLFSEKKVEVIAPGEKEQSLVMEAIYGERGVKAGFKKYPKKLFKQVAEHLQDKYGIDAVIAGCTEIPIALTNKDIEIPYVEPMKILAETCIRKSGNQVRGRGV